MTTRIEELAGWVAGLGVGDVPPPVLELCRVQRRSVLGGVAASYSDAATRRVLSAVERWAAPGPAPLIGSAKAANSSKAGGTPDMVRVEDSLYAVCTASIALDFDDYMCFGHTGHSAVLVPLLLAAETGSSAEEQLVAQVAANEIEARLGGACLIGPQNGQLWSFIHSAGAAVAAGKLLGLGSEPMAHALALALYQPARATAPGFFMPDSKVLTAAEPALAGLRAARLAAEGVTGPLDALDHPQGFFSAFAAVALPGMLEGLGEGWATSTLCVKPYPGCAYIDTAIDALGMLGWPRVEEVASVEVEASILTYAMDSMSAPYATASDSSGGSRGRAGSRASDALRASGVPTPVVVTFSIPWSVSVALVAGELTPAQVSDSWLHEHAADLREGTAKTRLRHDGRMSRRATESFAAVVPPGIVARALGVGGALRATSTLYSAAAHSARSAGTGAQPAMPRAMGKGVLEGLGALRGARGMADIAMLRDLAREMWRPGATRGSGKAPVAARWWDPEALASFAMTFPARVRVRDAAGREQVAEASVPRGAAGHPCEGPEAVAHAKLLRFGPALFGSAGTKAIDAAIAADDDRLWALAGSRDGEAGASAQ